MSHFIKVEWVRHKYRIKNIWIQFLVMVGIYDTKSTFAPVHTEIGEDKAIK